MRLGRRLFALAIILAVVAGLRFITRPAPVLRDPQQSLHVARVVAQVDPHQLAVIAVEHDPPGDGDHRAGVGDRGAGVLVGDGAGGVARAV